MLTLLADASTTGHVERLVMRMKGEPWVEFCAYLQVSCVSFADVGLIPDDSDAIVWQRCQEKGLLLITSNRNDDGPDSLQNTIRTRNTNQSLPVFTIADADRVLADGDYATQVLWSLFGYLFDMDKLLGTGRLYVPANAGKRS